MARSTVALPRLHQVVGVQGEARVWLEAPGTPLCSQKGVYIFWWESVRWDTDGN